MDYRFKFSVIIAAYNTADYLGEALDSVMNQSLGYDTIQVIVVNDGSTDNTWDIIKDYMSRYPNNVIGINKENGGVSSARNKGLEYVEGKYVNFLDSDDKFKLDCFSKVWDFFEAHEYETDIVCVPLMFFGRKKGGHNLNYKFNDGDRVIDLTKEWRYILNSMASSFVKRDAITDDLRFDTEMAISEDYKLITWLLLRKPALGVVCNTAYMYRRREEVGVSAIDGSKKNRKNYITPVERLYEPVMSYCKEKYGYVPKFVQYSICNDLHYKVQMETIPDGVLTLEEKVEFIEREKRIISELDDDVIIAEKTISDEFKYVMLKCKESPVRLENTAEGYEILLGENRVYSLTEKDTLRLDFIKIKDGICRIEGRYFTSYFGAGPEIVVSAKEERHIAAVELYELHGCLLDKEKSQTYHFTCEFNINTSQEYIVQVNFGMGDVIPKNTRYGKFFNLSSAYGKAYAAIDNYIVFRKGFLLCFRKNNPFRHVLFELRYDMELLFRKQKDKKKKKVERRAALVRPAAILARAFKRKPVWLFRDRIDSADDNGIVMFEYVTRNHPEIKTCFTISHKSPDYQKAEKIGNTVEIFSRKHKWLFLQSDFVISSAGEDDVFNPFAKHSEPYKDLIQNSRFVFLQHGVTKDDLSGWLNRFGKNIYGFITVSQREFESILEGRYMYDQKNVWLTGFPRYDRLTDAAEKIITIAPTWRQYLVGTIKKDGSKSYSSSLIKSSYFKAYQSLLNNEKLLKSAEDAGYRIQFVMHPSMRASKDLFSIDERIIIEEGRKTYNQIFKESSLLITDYSSVAFDFAYMKKPVLYYQFDREEFFANHTVSEGYFSYEDDGFGEVVYDETRLVELICRYIEGGCTMKKEYLSKVEDFFRFYDRNNCKRVFEKIAGTPEN